MKRLIAVLLLILGASLLEASTLEDFRNSFNELGSNIDDNVQVLRAENSDAILAMNQKMLRLLGNYTFEALDAFYTKNVSIQVDEWLNDNPNAQECFDWAYELVELLTLFTTWDIGWCATHTKEEISADAQYHFYSHAHYIMRAGTDGRQRVLESFGLYAGEDQQLEFLEQEHKWLEFLWDNYRTVLKEEVEGHADTAEWIAEELNVCLTEVMDDVAYWIEYVEYDLQYCLENVEPVDQ